MTELWDTISAIDDSVTQDDTTTKLLQGKTKLQAFLNHCTVRRYYYFMISKCGDISCKLCKPPRLPQDVFQGIHKLPDPVPTEDGDHFKSFEELYGTETTEKFRPSLVSKQTALAQRDFGFRLSGETVRRTILCTECSKPRCVYSPKKLVEAERQSLEQILDTIDYTCGTSAIPESHKLHKVCLFENVTCGNSITPHYYSSRLKFPLVCHVCGTPDDLVPIQDDWKESYQSIHPVCHQCKSIGHEERTRNKSKVGGKKKK
ncbi:uncharacterized protein [Ptychodera flava]|uniref:uncharacterized protein n=1 Tax=Ptychodera flava TaxID=63121 RepID=UPI00396A05CA